MSKMYRKVMGALVVTLCCAAIVAMFPISAMAEGKTLTVDASAAEAEGSVYTDVQKAINYINTQSDKTGWTIEVAAGSYPRFVVLDGLHGLTVKAADGAEPVIDIDCTYVPEGIKFGGGHPTAGGVQIWTANDVTLTGLTFNTSNITSSPWMNAMVTGYAETVVKSENLTVDSCIFKGTSKYGVFIAGTNKFTVKDSTFESGVTEAIEVMNDGNYSNGVAITGNTFNQNSFAVHAYWGGKPGEDNTLTISGNTMNGVGDGTTDRRCKIVIQDQTDLGSVEPVITDNTINNGIVGLINTDETATEVLSSNTMDFGSFAVDGVEPESIDLYASYKVFQGDYRFGKWAITGLDDLTQSNPPDAIETIQAAIDKANAEHSNVLNITTDPNGDFIHTFTWFKDGVYWVPYENGKLTVEKSADSAVEAGNAFTFKITLSGDEIGGNQIFYDGDPEDGSVENEVEFVDGVGTVTLSPGESLTLEGIPAGTTYSIEEEESEAYDTATWTGASGEIVANEEAKAVCTNKKLTRVVVDIVWDDQDDVDKLRPGSVVVHLYADGEDTGKVLEPTADGSWTGSFEDLDAFKDGQKIEYTVSQEGVDEYEAPVVSGTAEDGFTILNKHVPTKLDPMGDDEKGGGDGGSDDVTEPDDYVIEPDVPDTSDTADLAFWITLMAAAAVSMISLAAWKSAWKK